MMKWMLMMRSAGTPMLIMCSEALKSESSWRGKHWNRIVPAAMMHTAKSTASLMVPRMRFFFFAP